MKEYRTKHRLCFQSAADLGLIPDESIDLIVTSPPYPMIEMWDDIFTSQNVRIGEALTKYNGREAFLLMHQLLDQVWDECFRVLKPGSYACINIGDATRTMNSNFRLYSNHSRITSACENLGFQALPVVLWRKQTNAPNKFMGSGMLPAGAYVTLEHEYILIFRKGDKIKFSADEKKRRQESAYFWEERNTWFSDLWDFKGIKQKIPRKEGTNGIRSRSGAFPFELAYRLIQMYSLQEDTVLDPFAGTGTTAAAAAASFRNSCSVEIDPNFRSEIVRSILSSAEAGNSRIHERIDAHISFVNRRTTDKGISPKYVNIPHGFPVMTQQEQNLTLYRVEAIAESGENEITSVHRKLGDIQFCVSSGTEYEYSPRRQFPTAAKPATFLQ